MLVADNIEGPSQHDHEANECANGVANGTASHANGLTNGTSGEAVHSEVFKVAETATQQIVQGLKTVADSLSGRKTQAQQSGIAAVGDC